VRFPPGFLLLRGTGQCLGPVLGLRFPAVGSGNAADLGRYPPARDGSSVRARVTDLRAVLFDVDGTIAKPGPDLGPEGYRRAGERHGLTLAPDTYEEARDAALAGVERHPELEHDEEIWIAFTERIIRGMGGEGPRAHELAVEMTRAWEHSHNFDLYEDTLPVFDELRAQRLRIALISNTGRDLESFAAHHGFTVDAWASSRRHGRVKPHPSIFRAVLAQLELEPQAAAMVGDSLEDDVEGARSIGMRAFLLDRNDRHPGAADRLPDLFALPAALGLPRPGAAS
jgi:putative hydrolase of the HAD superfamily